MGVKFEEKKALKAGWWSGGEGGGGEGGGGSIYSLSCCEGGGIFPAGSGHDPRRSAVQGKGITEMTFPHSRRRAHRH